MYQLLQLLILQLKGEIIITGVTLEHISRELTPEGSFNSAPKDFSVWVCSLHVYYQLQTNLDVLT